MEESLNNALEVLEQQWGIVPPMGSDQMPDRTRFQAVLNRLARVLCSRKNEVLAVLNSHTLDGATIAADAFGSWVLDYPFVYTQIFRRLAIIGIDRFCANPSSIFDDP